MQKPLKTPILCTCVAGIATATALAADFGEAAALTAAKELYETMGLESETDILPICELIIEMKITQLMLLGQNPVQMIQAELK